MSNAEPIGPVTVPIPPIGMGSAPGSIPWFMEHIYGALVDISPGMEPVYMTPSSLEIAGEVAEAAVEPLIEEAKDLVTMAVVGGLVLTGVMLTGAVVIGGTYAYIQLR